MTTTTTTTTTTAMTTTTMTTTTTTTTTTLTSTMTLTTATNNDCSTLVSSGVCVMIIADLSPFHQVGRGTPRARRRASRPGMEQEESIGRAIGRCFPAASRCTSHTLRSELGGLTASELVYRTPDVVPGWLYVWEQRRFLAFMGIKDGRIYRKNEHDKGRWPALAEEWQLPLSASFAKARAGSWNTVMMSSGALFPWLAGAVMNFRQSGYQATSDKALSLLNSVIGMAAFGFAEQPSPSRIQLRGVQLTVGVGSQLSIDVTELLPVWPTILSEWEFLTVTKYPMFNIRALPSDGIVPLAHLVLVLWLRELVTKQTVPHLREARCIILKPVIAYFEVAVAIRLARPASAQDTVLPGPIFGPSDRKALHMSIHCKKLMLKNIVKDGSAETKLRVLQRHKGLALSVAATKSTLYIQRSQEEFSAAESVCLQWDEANHSSLCVLLGTATDMLRGFGAFLRPTARMGKCNIAKYRVSMHNTNSYLYYFYV